MSSIATTLSLYVNGLKDAVIEIAGWLEQTPEVFSVGKNGIVVNPTFAEKNQGAELSLDFFSQPSGEEILQKVAELDDEDEIKSHFSSLWNSKNLEGAEADAAWDEFVANMTKIGEGAQKAYSQAVQVLTNVQPDPSVTKEVPKKSILSSILGSIFGGGDKNGPAPEMQAIKEEILGENVQSASKGLWAMNFEDLQKLIAGLLQMSDSANAAAAETLVGINKQNEEVMEPSDEQQQFATDMTDIVKDPDLGLAVAAAAEDAGLKGGDTSTIDPEKFREALADDLDEDQKDHLLGEMELENAPAEEGGVDEKLLDAIEKEQENIESDIKQQEPEDSEEAAAEEKEQQEKLKKVDDALKKVKKSVPPKKPNFILYNYCDDLQKSNKLDLQTTATSTRKGHPDHLSLDGAVFDKFFKSDTDNGKEYWDMKKQFDSYGLQWQELKRMVFDRVKTEEDAAEWKKNADDLMNKWLEADKKIIDWWAAKQKEESKKIFDRWGKLAGIING
tara:strand:- start:16622 stop:18130 length:1509 start_codon:yes stop_codon:yes gene_type:complete